MSESVVKATIPLFEEDLEHILEHTRPLWEEARGKSFFITGGTGFFGMWLVESFLYINKRLSLGASICLLTRDIERYKQKAPHLVSDPSLTLIEGDVRSFEFPQGKSFEYLIHAGTTSSAPVPPLEMFSTIVDGTQRVLQFAKVVGTAKFLFVSSGAVYGPQPESLSHISEDYLGAPQTTLTGSAYGEGKRAAELICAMHSKSKPNMECKIARCFAFVGPHLPIDSHFAIGNFIRDAIFNKDIHIQGDGKTVRSYLYASDLAIWLWTILFRGKDGFPYNVGAEDAITIADLGRLVGTLVGSRSTELVFLPDQNTKSNRYVPSTTRALSGLGLEKRVTTEIAVSKTVRWISQMIHEQS